MTSRGIKRLIFFFVAILAGILIGILLGWGVISPNRATPNPESLRIDYQTDYVLMIAELYGSEKDLSLAEARLDYICDQEGSLLVQNAIAYAQEHQYASCDLALMLSLIADLQMQSLEVE